MHACVDLFVNMMTCCRPLLLVHSKRRLFTRNPNEARTSPTKHEVSHGVRPFSHGIDIRHYTYIYIYIYTCVMIYDHFTIDDMYIYIYIYIHIDRHALVY